MIHTPSRFRIKNLLALTLTFFILSLVFQLSELGYLSASTESQFPIEDHSEGVRSTIHASNAQIIPPNEDLQIYFKQTTQSDIESIITTTVVDYAEPSSPMRKGASFSTLSTDPCGDGSNEFTTNSGGVRWRSFPVTYAIDTSNSGVDPVTARNAVVAAFEEFDTHIPGETFTLITDFNAAKIKFKWEFIDGPFQQAGFASYSFSTPSLTLTSATITLDSGDSWFVSPVDRCNSFGSSFGHPKCGFSRIRSFRRTRACK